MLLLRPMEDKDTVVTCEQGIPHQVLLELLLSLRLGEWERRQKPDVKLQDRIPEQPPQSIQTFMGT